MTVFTIGHSTRSFETFLALLKAAAVDAIADVRRIPRSRRYPHFNAEPLAAALAAAGVSYHPYPLLGGRRTAGKQPSHNTLWRDSGFRNFADYAETPDFRAGLDGLMTLAGSKRPAIMCAEAVWWRCHRRIITDYLLMEEVRVEHILDLGKTAPATLTPGAQRLPNGILRYEADGTPRLL